MNEIILYLALCIIVSIGLLLAKQSGKYSRFLIALQCLLLLFSFYTKKNFLTVISLESLSYIYFFLYPRDHKDQGKSISSFIVSGSISAIFLSVWIFLPNGSMIGTYFLSIAVFIKSSLLLFHFWMPSAYENGTAEINSFSSGVMAIFPFFLFMEFVYPLWTDPLFFLVLASIASIGVFVGGVSSYFQSKVSLLLAYSSIEKLNFLWLCIALGGIAKTTTDVSFHDLEKPFIILFYFGLVQHSISKVFQFSLLGRIWKSPYLNNLNNIRGMGRMLGIPTALAAIGTMSFMAIPGTSGFLSESMYLLLSSQVLDIPTGRSIAVLPVLVLVFTGLVTGGVAHLRLFYTVFLSTFRTGEMEFKPALEKSKYNLDLYWLGAGIILPSLILPFLWFQYFPGNMGIWLRDSGFLSFVSLGFIFFILVFSSKKKSKEITWDCGSKADITKTSVTAETYSLPVRNSLGRYLVKSNGESRLDNFVYKIIHDMLNPSWYRVKQMLDEEDLSNYLAISSGGVLVILFLFFIKDVLGY